MSKQYLNQADLKALAKKRPKATPGTPAEELAKVQSRHDREALEDLFAYAWKVASDGADNVRPVRQYQFDEKRKFRFDFAWPHLKIAVEIQGGQWVNGAHNRGSGQSNDMEKKRLAIKQGWRVLEYGTDDLKKPLVVVAEVMRLINEHTAQSARA